MNILSNIKRALFRNDDTVTPTWLGYVDALVADTEAIRNRWQNVTTAREVAKRIHGPALGCALFNAKACASVPLRLFRPGTGGTKSLRGYKWRTVEDVRTQEHLRDFRRVGRKAVLLAEQDDEVIEVLDHPVLDLLQKPNPQSTGTECEVERWMNKWMFGNDLSLVIPGERSPSALVSLMPQFVRVQPDNERLIAHYWFGRQEHNMLRFDADDVIHLKLWPHWNNPYWGMSPMDIIFRELDLYEFSLAAEQSRWQRGGYPGGVLSLKNMPNQKSLDDVAREIEKRSSGVDKTGKLLVTSEGAYTQLGKTNEMGYLPGMEHIELRIEQEYGVPEAFRRMNAANLASSVTAVDVYMRYTINPALTVDAEQLTELLLPMFGIDPGSAWLAYDDIVPKDLEAIRQDTQVHVAGGVMKINEQRARMGLEPVEGGDELRINGVPLNEVGQIASQMPQQFGVASIPSPQALPPNKSGHRLKAVDDGLTAGLLDAGDSDELVSSIRADVESWIDDVRARFSVSPEGAVDLGAEQTKLEAAIMPRVQQLVEAGFDIGNEDLEKINVDPVIMTNEAATAIVRERGSLIIEEIIRTTEDQIRQAILLGVEEQRPLNEVIDQLKESLGEQAGARAERIARTETSNAVNAGRQEVWSEAGVTRNRWRLAPGACPICQALVALSGGEVDIGEPFVTAGTQLATFTPKMDITRPPAHPNCRCSMAPVEGS